LATVSIDRIAVVACFAGGGIERSIAAGFVGEAFRTASVATHRIAVVTTLAVIGEAIAAGFIRQTRCIATVAARCFAVVAKFAGIHEAIAAGFIGRTRGIAAVAVRCIAIVAYFTHRGDAIAAGGGRAIAVAAVALRHVAIIAHFAHRGDAIAARRRRAIAVAAIAVDGISVVAEFVGIHEAVSAYGHSALAEARRHAGVVDSRVSGGVGRQVRADVNGGHGGRSHETSRDEVIARHDGDGRNDRTVVRVKPNFAESAIARNIKTHPVFLSRCRRHSLRHAFVMHILQTRRSRAHVEPGIGTRRPIFAIRTERRR